MSRQFNNGSCSCWKQVDRNIAKHGMSLSYVVSVTGHKYLNVAKTLTIVARFCPFCGAKLKEPRP